MLRARISFADTNDQLRGNPMRAASARFENFARFQEGTGRSIIEIDFTPAHEAGIRKIGALGRNGSGKSTLLNSLHPLPDAGDGFNVIVPGRTGEKVVKYIMRDGTIVESVIQWTKGGKAAARLFVNGVVTPKTAKGLVTEHAAECAALLKFDSELLKIMRIQNRVDSFLEMGSTKRKNYIALFMPELEEWSVMHGHASKRVSVAKSELKGLSTEIEKLQPAEELNEQRSQVSASRDEARSAVADADQSVGASDAAMNAVYRRRDDAVTRAGGDPADPEFNPFQVPLENAATQLRSAQSTVSQLHSRSAHLQKFTDEPGARQKAAEMNGELTGARDTLAAATAQRSSARGRLDRLILAIEEGESSLRKADGAAEEITKLEGLAEAAEATRDALAEQLKTAARVPDDVDYQQFIQATEVAADVGNSLAEVRSYFESSDILDEADSLNFDEAVLAARATESRAHAKTARERSETAALRVNRLAAENEILKRVGGADAHCTNPKCPFEAKIIPMKEAATELADKQAEVDAFKKKAEETAGRADTWDRAAKGAVAAKRLLARLARFRSSLTAVGLGHLVSERGFFDLLTMADAKAKAALDLRHIATALRIKSDHAGAERTVRSHRQRISDLNGLVAARESIAAQAAALVAEHEQADAEVQSLDGTIEAAGRRISALEAAVRALETLADALSRRATAEDDIARLTQGAQEVDAAREEWETAKNQAAAARESRRVAATALEQAERQLADIEAKIARRAEYEARAEEAQGRLRKAAWVADATHPTTGAPVHFIRDYLDVTQGLANEMLDLAMGGEFRIGFSVDENEFRVPVYRGSGTTIPDVASTSDGQAALAKVVLSLALVKQAIAGSNGYDIVSLDEIDGALDREKNRERFVTILDRLIVDLGLEQLFFVSHNEYLHAEPAGLILFPGHSMPLEDRSFISNKIILANFA